MRQSLALNFLFGISCVLAAGEQKPIGDSTRAPEALTTTDGPSYRDDLISFHKQLCQTESLTGNEADVAYFLQKYLTERDYEVFLEELPPSFSEPRTSNGSKPKPRFNLIARHESKLRPEAPRILLTSHIDTVPPFIPYQYIPYRFIPNATSESQSIITGRGTVDAKASVAAQVFAHMLLSDAGDLPPGEVILAYVVGEEVDGSGMRFLSDRLAHYGLAFDAVIFGEPTEGKLACGHKGHLGCKVTAKGKAGHSGYPWLGKSATEVLMRGLVKVLDAELPGSERFGNTTVNVGLLEGGVASNVIPEHAEAGIAVRVATGPQKDGHEIVQREMEKVLNDVDKEALSLKCWTGYGAVDCNCDVDGFEKITVNYGTDVPHLGGNHTRYLYGPGDILVAHSDHEALTVGDLEKAVEDYKKLILHALKHDKQ